MAVVTSTNESESRESLDAQILLREHEYTSQMWEQNNQRKSEGVAAYLTIVGIIATGIAILSQLATSILFVFMAIEMSAVVLFVAGLLLQSRLVTGSVMQAGYVERLHRIRCYFMERSKNLEAYIPYPPRMKSERDYLEDVMKSLPNVLVMRVMLLWNSGLFAIASGGAVMLLCAFTGVPTWVSVVLALLAWIMCYGLLQFSIQARIMGYKKPKP